VSTARTEFHQASVAAASSGRSASGVRLKSASMNLMTEPVPSFVRNSVHKGERRDHRWPGTWPLFKSIAHGVEVADLGLSVVVEPIGFIVGDDDGAVRQ